MFCRLCPTGPCECQSDAAYYGATMATTKHTESGTIPARLSSPTAGGKEVHDAVQAQLAEARARVEKAKRDLEAAKVGRYLDVLENERYEFDRATETRDMIPMTDEQREDRVAYIRKFHARTLGDGTRVWGTSPEQSEAAVRLSTREGIGYDEALARILRDRGGVARYSADLSDPTDTTLEESNRAVSYATQNGCDYETALRKVKGR